MPGRFYKRRGSTLFRRTNCIQQANRGVWNMQEEIEKWKRKGGKLDFLPYLFASFKPSLSPFHFPSISSQTKGKRHTSQGLLLAPKGCFKSCNSRIKQKSGKRATLPHSMVKISCLFTLETFWFICQNFGNNAAQNCCSTFDKWNGRIFIFIQQ